MKRIIFTALAITLWSTPAPAHGFTLEEGFQIETFQFE